MGIEPRFTGYRLEKLPGNSGVSERQRLSRPAENVSRGAPPRGGQQLLVGDKQPYGFSYPVMMVASFPPGEHSFVRVPTRPTQNRRESFCPDNGAIVFHRRDGD